MSDSKSCSRCGAIKVLGDFHANRSSPDGRYSICRECKKVESKARRMARTAEQREVEAHRLRQSYQNDKAAKLAARKARYEANKPAALAKNREWRERNLEKHRDLCRSWARENPGEMRAIVARRRARVLGADGSYRREDIDRLRTEQGGLCVACRGDLEQLGYNVDHIHPLSRGGSNNPDNLQLLCPTCNRSKGSKLMAEWLQHGSR